jgi:hypothetical protein
MDSLIRPSFWDMEGPRTCVLVFVLRVCVLVCLTVSVHVYVSVYVHASMCEIGFLQGC